MAKVVGVKILCVDDESAILDALKRQLRNKYTLELAVGPEQGLQMIRDNGPYAVVLSDMRMPEMDGITFLKEVKKISPETVRMMLTGNSDQETAARAVNEGSIFRFLNKPSSTEEIQKAFDDALVQYRLVTAERELLQNTLSGSIKLLTDLLTFIDPISFANTKKMREPIQRVCAELKLTNSWEIELAAMLSNIGFVTVPSNVSAKVRKGYALTEEEQKVVQKIPEVGFLLISNIPRLENISEIIFYQNKNFDGTGFPSEQRAGESIPIGARLLRIIKDTVQLEAELGDLSKVFGKMVNRQGQYDPELLRVVIKIFGGMKENAATAQQTEIFEVHTTQLVAGQILMANVETKDGVLLISAGTEITKALHERIINYAQLVGIKEPMQVDCLIPIDK